MPREWSNTTFPYISDMQNPFWKWNWRSKVIFKVKFRLSKPNGKRIWSSTIRFTKNSVNCLAVIQIILCKLVSEIRLKIQDTRSEKCKLMVILLNLKLHFHSSRRRPPGLCMDYDTHCYIHIYIPSCMRDGDDGSYRFVCCKSFLVLHSHKLWRRWEHRVLQMHWR